MEAGTTGTVGFTIEHGCDGSPTTDVKFEIPEGVTGVTPVDKDGWTATVTGNTVEFKGGPLAADEEDHFDFTFTAPTQAGDIHFPVIQTCEQGELAWIEIAAEGAAEPEHPAPTLKVTEGPPTSADLMPEPEGEDATAETVAASTEATTLVAPLVDDGHHHSRRTTRAATPAQSSSSLSLRQRCWPAVESCWPAVAVLHPSPDRDRSYDPSRRCGLAKPVRRQSGSRRDGRHRRPPPPSRRRGAGRRQRRRSRVRPVHAASDLGALPHARLARRGRRPRPRHLSACLAIAARVIAATGL